MARWHSLSPEIAKSGLRRSMLLFLSVISIAVVLINGWALWNSWQRTVEHGEEDARNLSQSLSRQAEDTFLQVDLTLQDLRDRVEMIGMGPEQKSYLSALLINRKAALPQLHGLFIYDEKGNWLVTSYNKIPLVSNNADREYFRFHREHNDTKVHIGQVIRSRTTGDLIIPLSMRLNNPDGSFHGVVLGTIRIDFFRQVYSYYNLGDRDTLSLLLSNGVILYSRPFPDSVINRNMSQAPLFSHLLKASSSGTADYRSVLDGVERILGYATLKRYPLVVVAGFDKKLLLQAWFSDLLIYVTVSTLLLLVICLLGYLVMRHIRQNLQNQVELTEVRDQLTAMNHTLQSLALLDGLTGLANRRQFDLFLHQQWQRVQAEHCSLSLLMIDVDSFKLFNDRFGHQAGDECLRRVAGALNKMVPGNNALVARYGGEEFAIILTESGSERAMLLAQRVLEAVRMLAIPHETSQSGAGVVTLSIGVATLNDPEPGQQPQALVATADAALYQAKHQGRNQVVAG